MEPGGSPVQVVVTLFNSADVVEQYTLEVTGLESDWYTAPVNSVGLFPQDSDTLQLTLHPPRRPGVKAGTYPFRVIARSRGGLQEHSAEGILDLRGYAIYRVNMTPRQLTGGGSGTYRVELSNTGTADSRMRLEGRDAEDTCRFKYPKGQEVLVAANTKTEVPIVVQPKRRPWVGADRAYDFNVTVRPVDTRGEPQTVSAQFTQHPPFRRLPILPILKWLLIVLVILVVLGVLAANEIPQQLGQRVRIASAQLCGAVPLGRVPVLGGACPEAPAGSNPDRCVFALGFKAFATEQERLVGRCTTDEYYDRFGNSIQWTTTGVLFWLKSSNTVYFYERDSLYSYVDGKLRLLDGSGQPPSP
jgi:hypothetical protein